MQYENREGLGVFDIVSTFDDFSTAVFFLFWYFWVHVPTRLRATTDDYNTRVLISVEE